jgi:hypothetical protein
MEAIRNFAKTHGRFWKRELHLAWMKAGEGVTSYSAELQQIRNDPDRGQTWLSCLKI